MYRHGQLPLWNPYIFSGTPLMADFNAGAFHPLIGLFAILPDRAAWLATEVILFSAIAVGMYVFLRALALSVAACVLGAATFAFAGPVLSQVNHVDMTEGFVAIPWLLLSVLHIVRDGRWRWSIVFGIAYATVILGGAPEAMLDEALLVLAYAVMSAGVNAERWRRVLSRGAAGIVLALSLAAIQWLPGLEAIRNSQRGSGVFAAAGSFPTPFSIFALVPYLDGGYGGFGEQQFFSQYNLPEVGLYLGVLPLIAILTLVHRRWPSRLPPRDRLDVVRGRGLRLPPCPRLQHTTRARVQQPAALRASAPPEPQHDHGGDRHLRAVRGLGRPHRLGDATAAGPDATVGPDHGSRAVRPCRCLGHLGGNRARLGPPRFRRSTGERLRRRDGPGSHGLRGRPRRRSRRHWSGSGPGSAPFRGCGWPLSSSQSISG